MATQGGGTGRPAGVVVGGEAVVAGGVGMGLEASIGGGILWWWRVTDVGQRVFNFS